METDDYIVYHYCCCHVLILVLILVVIVLVSSTNTNSFFQYRTAHKMVARLGHGCVYANVVEIKARRTFFEMRLFVLNSSDLQVTGI